MVVWIVLGVVVLVIVLSIVRLVWSFRNDEPEPGGSYGTQLFGRRKRETTDDF
jgi:hypothetical protein